MRLFATLAAVLFATAALGKDSSEPIPRVDAATAKRDGAKIVIAASGTVPTAGWKNARLVQLDEKTFEFRAEPPEGMAAQVITVLTATLEVESPARTVVVKARQNAIETKVSVP